MRCYRRAMSMWSVFVSTVWYSRVFFSSGIIAVALAYGAFVRRGRPCAAAYHATYLLLLGRLRPFV